MHWQSFVDWCHGIAFQLQKNVLIVCAHRPGRSPSQRYRFEQYLSDLERLGYRFTWSFLLDQIDDDKFYSHGGPLGKFGILVKGFFKRLGDIRKAPHFDLIFIQREAFFVGGAFFEKRLFLSGKPIIFDFDDSIWLEDTSPGNKTWAWLKKPAKFYDNLRYARVVIAGNGYLAAEAKPYNGRVSVIPTTIDTNLHKPKPELRNKEPVTIGWSGSISTIKHFETLIPVYMKLVTKYGTKIRFKILGATNYSNPNVAITSVAWTPNNEVDELNSFDIGVMPLPDDEWTRGKCGLKALSYMACEVPCVVSPVGVNTEIISAGTNGLLAKTEGDWFQALDTLIRDRPLRETLGKAGRLIVEEHFSVNAHRAHYADVFELALTNHELHD